MYLLNGIKIFGVGLNMLVYNSLLKKKEIKVLKLIIKYLDVIEN